MGSDMSVSTTIIAPATRFRSKSILNKASKGEDVARMRAQQHAGTRARVGVNISARNHCNMVICSNSARASES